MNDDSERIDRRFIAIADCLDAEVVSTWRHVGERQFVLSNRYYSPLFSIDAVGIANLLHVIIGESGELERERVVIV